MNYRTLKVVSWHGFVVFSYLPGNVSVLKGNWGRFLSGYSTFVQAQRVIKGPSLFQQHNAAYFAHYACSEHEKKPLRYVTKMKIVSVPVDGYVWLLSCFAAVAVGDYSWLHKVVASDILQQEEIRCGCSVESF